ncbi:MAG: MFS transporter, partial [Candidatus Eremiobacteraeota bacterium]|nr:MFS transporter [Candidatus Eremiobacteraeota bacterium]
ILGLSMLPFIVLMVLLSRFSGALAYRIGARSLLVAGPLVTAAGFALLALLRDLHYWNAIFPAVTCIGFGMGLTVAPLTTTLLESVPEGHVGLASGVNNATSRVAGRLSIAVLGVLLGVVFNARLSARIAQLSPQLQAQVDAQRPAMAAARFSDPRETAAVRDSYADGFRAVAFACAFLAAASAGVSATAVSGRRS